MTTIVRGATVLFTSVFYDEDNEETNPASVTLTVRYKINGAWTTEDTAMTVDGFTWSAVWESEGVDPGVVYWIMKTSGPTIAARQGTFALVANKANPRS